jgi:aspartate/methionine/tyrosine aminotransferase
MKYAMFKWTEIGPLMIGFSTGGRIADEVWEKFVHDLKRPAIRAYLGASIGILEVTSIQRKQVAYELKGRNLALAVVTDENLVRGIVTAASWLGMNVRSFSWLAIGEALEHLQVPANMAEKAIETIHQLRKSCEEDIKHGDRG